MVWGPFQVYPKKIHQHGFLWIGAQNDMDKIKGQDGLDGFFGPFDTSSRESTFRNSKSRGRESTFRNSREKHVVLQIGIERKSECNFNEFNFSGLFAVGLDVES